MKNRPRKVFERIYIFAAKTATKQGWVLTLYSMDGFSEFAFNPVLNTKTQITVEVLDELFDNALKDYKPIFHPKQIVFVTNLSEEYEELLKQTKAARHRFVFNKEVTLKAMHPLLSKLPHELVEL